MKLTQLLGLALATGVLALTSCVTNEPSTASPSVAVTAWQEATDAYAFVFLLAGPREGKLDTEELRAAREGHFGNMKRLADEGVLLIAGPLTDPRSDLRHRGVFIFDVDDVDEAMELAETDPSVQLGAYELAAYPFSSPQDLGLVLELEREAIEAKAADPDADGPGTRPYLLATADAEAALPLIEHLEDQGQAFFHGTFGGELEGTAIVALDALRKDAAETLLADASTTTGIEVEWTLHGWFSTESITALARGK